MHTKFKWFDYFFFVLMLVFSALIGIYYGFVKKQKTATDYLLGGKQMTIWPVAMSMVSSQLSGLVIISFSADVYRYGITFWLLVPVMIFVSITIYYVYLPVFYKLDVTSIYEYLHLRFDNKVRMFGSMLFTIQKFLALPIVIYVPALALAQVTDVSIHIISPIVCCVCVFYTTIGGIKAIVRTDALQFVILIVSLFLMLIIGIWANEGLLTIFEKAYKGKRLDISFELSPFKRDTFWTGTLASFFMFTNHFGCNQLFVQKCLSLPTYDSVKSALILSTIGIMLVKTFCMFAGLIMFAKYSECDPVEQKIIKSHDQLLPMYVMDETSFIPGLPGLILSGIFSAALSTLAAGLNCLAATIYTDFLSPLLPINTPQEKVGLYLKFLVALLGIFSTVCVLIIEKMGSLLQLAFSFGSITAGPLLGIFSVGMLVPRVNSKGALYGGIIAFFLNAWLVIGGLWYKMQGVITYPILTVSSDGCNQEAVIVFNETLLDLEDVTDTDILETQSPFLLYRISFYWYVMIGACVVLIFGIAISCCTKDDKVLNEDCISPLVKFLVKNETKKNCNYNVIENPLQPVVGK